MLETLKGYLPLVTLSVAGLVTFGGLKTQVSALAADHVSRGEFVLIIQRLDRIDNHLDRLEGQLTQR